MFSAYKLRDIYIIWLMILQGIYIARKKYMIADSEQKHRNNPNRMSDVEIMVISILFDSGSFCCFRH